MSKRSVLKSTGLSLSSSRGKYRVQILNQISEWHPSRDWKWKRAILFHDSKLKAQANAFAKKLRQAQVRVDLFAVRGGEQVKRSSTLQKFYRELFLAQVDRSCVLIAMGGGALGDAVGFTAATYLRGLDWVNLPTSLLAQVDSSIGGKTGINLEAAGSAGKNLVGAFHPPRLVLCISEFLKTLPARELRSGRGELFKTALLSDRNWFFEMAQPSTEPKRMQFYPAWILRSLKFKKKVVERDEFEGKGLRQVLNLGHSIAHALEAVTQFQVYRHGEAVLLGLRLELALSVVKGLLSWDEFVALDEALERETAALPRVEIAQKPFFQALLHDKKNHEGKIRMVLLRGVGHPLVNCEVSSREILLANELGQPLQWRTRR